MIIKIVIFLVGLVVGFLLSWIYNFITDKLNIAKVSFSLSKKIIKHIYKHYDT
jgi:hypothetical protein